MHEHDVASLPNHLLDRSPAARLVAASFSRFCAARACVVVGGMAAVGQGAVRHGLGDLGDAPAVELLVRHAARLLLLWVLLRVLLHRSFTAALNQRASCQPTTPSTRTGRSGASKTSMSPAA